MGRQAHSDVDIIGQALASERIDDLPREQRVIGSCQQDRRIGLQ